VHPNVQHPQIAQCTACYELGRDAGGLVHAVARRAAAGHEVAARGDHPLDVGGVHRHGLLDQNVLPALQGLDGQFVPVSRRCREDDRVDVGIGDQFLAVAVRLADAVLRHGRFRALGHEVGHGRELDQRAALRCPQMRIADLPAADDPQSHPIHSPLPSTPKMPAHYPGWRRTPQVRPEIAAEREVAAPG
jgi:hypothetical protein